MFLNNQRLIVLVFDEPVIVSEEAQSDGYFEVIFADESVGGYTAFSKFNTDIDFVVAEQAERDADSECNGNLVESNAVERHVVLAVACPQSV